ncbi:hypothetical protein [Methylibium sp.]|uniref:hypothetical protein n=1 Tax=Methylibium sp. TaxID=2067992 RepID=UPI00183D9ED7|nr:hypothetical protein [Methylibium sp.]MBA3591091.1 hypothetical protein [Methylibium sp.]
MKMNPKLTLCAVAFMATLAGCATDPAGRPDVVPSLGGLFGSGLSPALESQRSRLKNALSGTPVVIEATEDQRLRVEVPARFSFDPGRAAVKPALAAVLDQLAVGFKPQAATTELRVGVPAGDDASPRLVQERGASTRDYLIGRGVPVSRIVGVGQAVGGVLEIVVSDRPTAR